MSDRRNDMDSVDDMDSFEGMDESEGTQRGEEPTPPNREGVRILGADEARAAVESGRAQGRRPGDERRFGDLPERPDPSVRPVARFPTPQGEQIRHDPDPEVNRPDPEVSWSASREGLVTEERAETGAASGGSGAVELPHWADPATGEVPMLVPESERDDIDEVPDEAWSNFASGAPRFRGGAEDWSDADFGGDLKDDATSVGALADHEPVDDDEHFEQQIASRRPRRSGTPRRTRRSAAAEVPDDNIREGDIPEAEILDDEFSDDEHAFFDPLDDSDDGGGGMGAVPPDLTLRLVTAGVMVVVALTCFWLGRAATAILVAAIVGLATIEFYDGLRRRGFQPATPLGLLGSVGLVIVAYLHGSAAYPMMIALVVLFSLLWYMAEVVRARPVSGLGATLLGFLWIGGLGAFGGLLLGAPNGVGLIVGVALCAIAYDVAGYFVGSQFGKRPLLPHISPNKTVEGLAGGMAASVVVGFLTSTILGLTPWDGRAAYGFWLGVVVAITAPLGDLCESMIKRDLGIKDFGSILPGHGGVMDRFDGLLLSLPAVYYLVLQLGIG